MKPWEEWTEDELTKFIMDNKDKFEITPRPEVETSFLKRLNKIIISIVPYLIKVLIIVLIIWGISIALWYFFDLPTLWSIFIKWIG